MKLGPEEIHVSNSVDQKNSCDVIIRDSRPISFTSDIHNRATN